MIGPKRLDCKDDVVDQTLKDLTEYNQAGMSSLVVYCHSTVFDDDENVISFDFLGEIEYEEKVKGEKT